MTSLLLCYIVFVVYSSNRSLIYCYRSQFTKNKQMYNDFLSEHFSGKNGALSWSILVVNQKHRVQKPYKTMRLKPKSRI